MDGYCILLPKISTTATQKVICWASVLLVGIVSQAAMFAKRLIPCWKCSHKRRLNQQICKYYGAEQVKPSPDGREIFEDAVSMELNKIYVT